MSLKEHFPAGGRSVRGCSLQSIIVSADPGKNQLIRDLVWINKFGLSVTNFLFKLRKFLSLSRDKWIKPDLFLR